MTDGKVFSKVEVLERRIDALEENMEHGFAVVADTEAKIGKYTDLQTILIIITFVIALAALLMATFALRIGG